ncbi:hypothetical protein E2C01_073745 [Portunus trituberculatus]|uniref:Uncharacterized protein n=1 Tax=Portunus trituberculatus TaxID=210409 RepID=A0A5B7IBD5_PORTR|nr:hypothetical protein [Portunus trituberculatus]
MLPPSSVPPINCGSVAGPDYLRFHLHRTARVSRVSRSCVSVSFVFIITASSTSYSATKQTHVSAHRFAATTAMVRCRERQTYEGLRRVSCCCPSRLPKNASLSGRDGLGYIERLRLFS